jgi:CheY-like chemotaxis protein
MGSKILLADDSITIQKVVNLTFSDEGIEVVAVSNGDVAERRLNEVKPDLVLADIFMPGKNGYELCEAIKQNPQFRNVPVVLLVGAFEPFDQAEARRVRADAHLTKPFESRTLVETVRRLINASARAGGGPVAAMTPADEPRDDNGGGRDSGSITSELPAGRFTAPSAPKLDLSAMMADTNAPSTASARSTGELSSRMGDFHTQAFDVTVAGASAREALTATLIDTDEPFETMEFASTEFTSEEVSSSLALDTGEPILDFERSEVFESPAHQPPVQEDISFETGPGAESSQSSPQPMNFDMNVETAFEAPHDNGASLLAADEPLGDVLDEASPIEPPFQDGSANDSLNLELSELETVSPAPGAQTQFDLIDTPDASSSEAPAEAEDHTEEQKEEHQTTPPLAADWTSPRAGAYSTAQLDSVIMPIETAAYLAQDSLKESERSEGSQEASFTPPASWTEEEARFAAIDIEAVPVDDHSPQLDSDVSDESPEYVETPAVSAAREPANGASSTSELSAAAIEEIVRRVIAEMSDSVVREVAWEVVPDCVERVVDQLTRESLSKPT